LNYFSSNLRGGLRQIIRNPGFSVITILGSALGIGLAATTFTIVYNILLGSPSFPLQSRIALIGEAGGGDLTPGPSSLPNVRDWRSGNRSFEDIAYWHLSSENLTLPGGSELVSHVMASTNLFPLLHAQPLIGRLFYQDESQLGRDNVALLSAYTWKHVFSSDPGIVDKTIQVGGGYYTVVGVLREDFLFPLTELQTLVWTPFRPRKEWEDRDVAMSQVIGRLKKGVGISVAQADLTGISRRSDSSSKAVLVEDYRRATTGYLRTPLYLAQIAILAVWLVTTLNVSSLLFIRANARQREIAIRYAVGASPSRIASQLITESAVSGSIAGGLGACITIALVSVIRSSSFLSTLPFASVMRIDTPIILSIVLLSVLSILLCGSLPAIRVLAAAPQNALRDWSVSVYAGRRAKWVRGAVVISEISLSFVLLLGAGLLLRTVLNLRAIPLGFVPDRVVVTQIPLFQGNDYKTNAVDLFWRPLLQDLKHLPGVEEVGLSTSLPLNPNTHLEIPVEIYGRPDSPDQRMIAQFRIMTPDFHKTLRIPLIKGRYFADIDSPSAPYVAIVNKTFAHQFFDPDEALGKQVRVNTSGPRQFATIVGIVGDTLQRRIVDAPLPEIDLDYIQVRPTDELADAAGLIVDIAIRGSTHSMAVTSQVRNLVKQLLPQMVTYTVSPFSTVVDDTVSQQVFVTRMISIFASIALFVSVFGLYGLLAYEVSQSRRDIGVRFALGACKTDVILGVLRRSLLLVLLGLCMGGTLWIFLGRLLRSYVFGVSVYEPWTVGVVVAVLGICGLIVSLVPAYRGAAVDPMTCLRAD
jgi:predicted permease